MKYAKDLKKGDLVKYENCTFELIEDAKEYSDNQMIMRCKYVRVPKWFGEIPINTYTVIKRKTTKV